MARSVARERRVVIWAAAGVAGVLSVVGACAEPVEDVTLSAASVESTTTTERQVTTTDAPTTTEEPTTTTAAPTTLPPTTTTAPPPPPPSSATRSAPSSGCHPSYDPCVPIASDVDCAGGSGNGPAYTGPVRVVGPDEYDLDQDGNGMGCE